MKGTSVGPVDGVAVIGVPEGQLPAKHSRETFRTSCHRVMSMTENRREVFDDTSRKGERALTADHEALRVTPGCSIRRAEAKHPRKKTKQNQTASASILSRKKLTQESFWPKKSKGGMRYL